MIEITKKEDLIDQGILTESRDYYEMYVNISLMVTKDFFKKAQIQNLIDYINEQSRKQIDKMYDLAKIKLKEV